MEGLKTLKACGNILISHLNDEYVLLFSHQTSSMHLTETHGHNSEIHNIVLSSESISLTYNKYKLRSFYILYILYTSDVYLIFMYRITFISNHDGWITYNKSGYYYVK